MIVYTVERKEGRVIVKKNDATRLNAPEESYLIFKRDGNQAVSKVKDLPDEQLLLALANIIDIPVP